MPAAHHVLQVVKPGERPVRIVPDAVPAVVGRADVRGEPFLQSVELIRTDVVGLSGLHGDVAVGAQVVGEGRHREGVVAAAVEDLCLGGQTPGHQPRAGGHAERGVGVVRVENRAVGRDLVQARSLHYPVAIGGQEVRRQLVGHQKQDVR